MKIKRVCQLTGLSDRAVRYYIEEALIQPSCTENYLGRKNFDFSDADVKVLQDIAVLRKFGFSIQEIREIAQNPGASVAVLAQVRRRKQTVIAEEQASMGALSRLENGRCYTLAELAAGQAAPVAEKTIPAEDQRRMGQHLRMLRKHWFAAVLVGISVLLMTVSVAAWLGTCAYPVFDGKKLYGCFLILLPALCILLVYLPRRRQPAERQETVRKWIRGTVLTLCAAYLLLFGFAIFLTMFLGGPSTTTEPENYLQLDRACPANGDVFFRELFPQTVSDVRDYHYWYETSFFGEKYDISAQCFLRQEEFDAEIRRAEALFAGPESLDSRFQVVTLLEGDYTCLIRYWRSDGRMPFSPSTGDYHVYIFAYDPEHLQVRYILCASSQGGDPCYFDLKW